mmetsp:Transcript_12897/g.14175  ORF Transcript_12897/g.14175 Transcript_12897/m.14175 type:complete len:222 (-) Transcript_12897:95-760(-)|eukprot:CAMPEP_0115010324 /NCGR_PEP_ID=MMETSP0216-20121206/23237_1 /TAXON_ID=223996 /ORGANISM="Protocruzia adherens, Strain Boccale" /LENGTH=221 /DNA_ID=CAMNT_0002378495 /DNA_START=37 /DNA_END=702 /DNA_ORIENTATION=-
MEKVSAPKNNIDLEAGGNIQNRSMSKSTTVRIPNPPISDDMNTLDEPIKDTIMRDLKQIGFKLKYVMNPRVKDERAKELRNWDLWGPLLLCLALALTLSIGNLGEDKSSQIFTLVFFMVWVGAAVVTINAKLLGGEISFFQSVCVLGYCIAPLNISALLCVFGGAYIGPFKILLILPALAWGTKASSVFMEQLVPKKRKIMAVYPVCLFYIFLGWLILVAS